MGLCKRRNLRRNILIMAMIWFCFGIAYYGIVSMLPRLFKDEDDSPPMDPGSPESPKCTISFDFEDLAISAASEVVGVMMAICLVDRAGRTWSQFTFYGIGAACI